MNKKIVGGISVGVVTLIAITIGGIFYLQNNKSAQIPVSKQQPQSEVASKQDTIPQQNTANKQTENATQNVPTSQLPAQQTQVASGCNLPPKDGYVRITGKVNFPKGIKNPEKYQVAVKMTNKFPLATDGTFCAYADKYTSMLSVSSGGKNDFPLIYFVVGNKDKRIVVDAQSTAVGMVYTSGVVLLATDDSNKSIANLTKIGNNIAVKKLTQEIENKDVLSGTDFDSGPIAATFEVASKSSISEITSGK